jgi:hypothetical protein
MKKTILDLDIQVNFGWLRYLHVRKEISHAAVRFGENRSMVEAK